MKVEITYKVGDRIVNFGRVHEIFKITEEALYYRPHFEEPHSGGLICSIPLEKVGGSDLREPICKSDCKEMCKKLKKRFEIKEYIDANEMTSLFNSNKPENLIEVLSLLNQESRDKDNGLSTSKRTLLDKAIINFAQEYAYATETPLEEAQEYVENFFD